MGFASLRFRTSMATRWKMRLFLFPCNERRRRTGITDHETVSVKSESDNCGQLCHVTACHSVADGNKTKFFKFFIKTWSTSSPTMTLVVVI